jgi:hypothetical protein
MQLIRLRIYKTPADQIYGDKEMKAPKFKFLESSIRPFKKWGYAALDGHFTRIASPPGIAVLCSCGDQFFSSFGFR